jgi:two-component system cell cycle response regulator DivK
MNENNKTVLIVEDNDDTRDLLRHYLGGKGWRVVEAANGQEGIELASQAHPDLIIMDLSLPKVNGLEAIRRISQIDNLGETPIMVVSAHGDLAIEFFKAQDIPTGRLLYLAKPFEIPDLELMLADLFPAETR